MNGDVALVSVGSNLGTPGFPTPLAVCRGAVAAMAAAGLDITGCSQWFESEPVPPSDQPWFVNGVVRIEPGTEADPQNMLDRLHAIEAAFGRLRSAPNAARTLDLDLLALGDTVIEGRPGGVVLPHPRLHLRAFVLLPLAEVAPGWRHPVSGQSVDALIAALPPDQVARPARGPDS